MVQALGAEALASGLRACGFTRLHERALASAILPDCSIAEQKDLIARAGAFFARIISQYANAPPSRSSEASHVRIIEVMSRRNGELAQRNRDLHGIVKQLQFNDKERLRDEGRKRKSPTDADLHATQLRNLSRQILLTQEEERKRISRELHDVIAQSLVAVNVHLAALKKKASLNISSLNQNIGTTQRLVARSARIVHQFARELRPMALDDLGLAPAIESYVNQFQKRTGIKVDLQVLVTLDILDSVRRTVLFRVVQEALTNVDRHAGASQVQITLSCDDNLFTLRIKDDGKSFRIESQLQGMGHKKRLGLLGMRERVEMVGGIFHIESERGEGTTIEAIIPVGSHLSLSK
ncbi:MAG: sensor histidine kinase [Opitutales bacterium]|nr:sensor histidine kinase [Opitutales bacterium]